MKIIDGPPNPKGPVFGKHKDYILPLDPLTMRVYMKDALRADIFYCAKEDKEILRVWK